MPYYSLYIPSIAGADEPTEPNSAQSSYVFIKKCQALEFLKQHKDARLREFNSEDAAVQYSQTGYEVITTRYADTKMAATEKTLFRTPSKQELIEFRKIIESGDYERVKSIIWDNPRYLISSGDTPTMLKEGYRYNAMHVCAISKKPRIAELILQTVSDPKFADFFLGSNKEDKTCKELCANLLDYYLNIPEKGRSETPLHFAAKFVCVEVVEVLTSYPEIKMTPNNEGLLPKDIIGSRNAQAAPEDCKKIKTLLEERFYVPVLRTMDGSMPPQIGQFFSANKPPNLNNDPLSPEVKIQALAGPMNMEQAVEFRRRWKTPPRIGSSASSPIANNPYISPMKPRNGTPVLNKMSTSLGQQHDNSITITANRELFQTTPRSASSSSSAMEKVAAADLLPELELNGEKLVNGYNETNEMDIGDTLDSIDKQNGNHEANVDVKDGKMVYNEQTETTTVLDVKMETNNNHEAQPTITVKTRELHITETALFPSTPVMKSKKSAFFTYRDHYAPSPIDFGVLNTDGCIATCDEEESGDTPIRNVRRRPMPANPPNTPLLKYNKATLLPSQLQAQPQASAAIEAATVGDNELHVDVSNTSMVIDRSMCDTPGYKERHIKITDTEKGLEIIGRELAKEQKVEWREYWDFLDAFIDIASMDGLHQLENYFAQRLNTEELAKKTATHANDMMLAEVCSVLDKFAFASGDGGHTGGMRNSRSEYARIIGGMSVPSDGGTGAATNTATTPYTCVEKSLQVFAKRMTKTIIHNINNVVSINDTLMSELKRLKSLICSFKEDARFLDVNFTKVHSRIGNLVSIYLENSQEITVKSKIQAIIKNLLTATSDRREHIECVCARIYHTLTHPTEQIQPENLKTEAMCAKVWLDEKECDCQWETNLSRKVSRRNRMESRYKNIQQFMQQDHSNKSNTNDETEEDVFWSDFEDSDSDEGEDEEEIWLTPPESPTDCSQLESAEEDEGYKTYIYGNEPTKRDLDVLNAIFHVDVDKEKYPNVYAWRETLMRYPNEEMDFFPSPSVVRKSQSFVKTQQGAKTDIPQTPPSLHKRTTPHLRMPAAAGSPNRKVDTPMSATAKRLFMSTGVTARPKPTAPNAVGNNQPAPAVTSITSQPSGIQQRNQMYMSPLTRLRGLFYRDRSPLSSASSASPAYMGDRSGSDGSSNLSLLNISAVE